MASITDLKSVFTRVANFTKDSVLLYNNNKIFFKDKIYVRGNEGSSWSEAEGETIENIGFIPYDKHVQEINTLQDEMSVCVQEINELQNEISDLQKKLANKALSNKIYSEKNFNNQKAYIHKVMKSISIMKTIGGGNNLAQVDDKLKKSVVWADDEELRLENLSDFYLKSFATKTSSKSVIYSYYRRLSIFSVKYKDLYGVQENNYSRFHQDLMKATSKTISEITKFEKKIDTFTKVFELLPVGCWSICEIPLTYWNLIYNQYWEEIINCIKENRGFPYGILDEMRTAINFKKLSLHDNVEEEVIVVSDEEVIVVSDEEFEG